MTVQRRDFLAMAAASALAASWAAPQAADVRSAEGGEVKGDLDLFSLHEMSPAGRYYEATVPDTLDLAAMAQLALKGLLNFLDPDRSYELYQMGRFNTRPAYMSHYGAVGVNWGKIAESILMARHMSGSTENLDKQAGMFAGIFALMRENGQFAVDDSNAWVWKSQPNPTVIPANTSRMMLAFMVQNQLRPSARLTSLIAKMGDSICEAARVEGDSAYLPGEIDARGPELGNYQFMWNQGESMRGVIRTYALTGDKKYLEMCRKFINGMLEPKNWTPEAAPNGVPGNEHGQFEGHIHSWTQPLMGMLWYADLTNDAHLKEFVRESYEYVRTFWLARIGMFGEMCVTGDMTWLAVKLSDTGVGDYWEDADQYVRNHMAEQQITDGAEMHRVNDMMPALTQMDNPQYAVKGYTTDSVIDRCVGAWRSDASNPVMVYPQNFKYTICCSGNNPPGLYAAWEGTVRYSDGIARVNLLLNRASPWLDMDSYLPYEGKVVIRNKMSKTMFVRIPRWVDDRKVKISVNGRAHPLAWVGRYVYIDGVKANDVIRIDFPMVESTETYTLRARPEDKWWEGTAIKTNIQGFRDEGSKETVVSKLPWPQYTLHLKGNTVVDITPRPNGPGYPLYQRGYYRKTEAPMRQTKRYASPLVVKW